MNDLQLHLGLALPRDIPSLRRHAAETDAALLLLDPVISRLGDLDTHRDSEVRQALEPVAALADTASPLRARADPPQQVRERDPLALVMGSRAFTAVARSVHTVVPDSEDPAERRRLFGTPKNNLGRLDLPTLSFTVESHGIETPEGTAWTGRLEWGEEQAVTIGEAMRRSAEDPETKSATRRPPSGWRTTSPAKAARLRARRSSRSVARPGTTSRPSVEPAKSWASSRPPLASRAPRSGSSLPVVTPSQVTSLGEKV